MLDIKMGLDVMCYNGIGTVADIIFVENDRSSMKEFEKTLADMAEVDPDESNVYRVESKEGKYIYINCSMNGIVFGTNISVND